jgi:hexosaminidase
MKKQMKKLTGINSIYLLNMAFLCMLGFAAGATPNIAPATMPSIREWTGAEGMLTLAKDASIVVDSKYAGKLTGTASTLHDDLKLIGSQDCPVVQGAAPQAGGIFLTLNDSETGIGDEGYVMEVGDAVTIRAKTDTGVFYGTQTLLQILKRDSTHSVVPKGAARDYPSYGYRSEMIDVGRRYFQMSYLEGQIRQMAWYKMNMFHLHFTDWDGFRLVSDTYPGLATQPAYTKADIRRLQDVAKRYHVIIVPEIDLPAHAKAITDYDPKLRFTCPSMDTAHWEGATNGGWMLDITRPDVREWIKKLLDEFIPQFDGPYFHIGCDEWEYTAKQEACPELMNYIKAKGYGSPTDAFVDWINEVNKQVKSYGKTTQLWNWWDFRQHSTIQPDKDIVVNVWTDSPKWFMDRGWKVVISTEDGPDALYVSPGDGGTAVGQYGFADSKRLYEKWVMPSNSDLMLGFQLCRWMDKVESKSDEWLDSWSHRPLEVVAERTWGGPRSATVEEFYSRVDSIGAPPAVAKDAK